MSDDKNWNKWIEKVESVEFPDVSVRINGAQKVVSVRETVASHLELVKANNGKRAFEPYMRRLWMLYQMNKKGLLLPED